MYPAKVDDFEKLIMDALGKRASIVYPAAVVWVFMDICLCNEVVAKQWWQMSLMLAKMMTRSPHIKPNMWMALVFFKAYDSLLPLCVIALGINPRWWGRFIHFSLFGLLKCVALLCQGFSYLNDPSPPAWLKSTHTHTLWHRLTHTHCHSYTLDFCSCWDSLLSKGIAFQAHSHSGAV